MEIQLQSPFSDRAQELAAVRHTSVNELIEDLIVQESAHQAMTTQRLRALLLERHQEVLDGKTVDAEAAFERILGRLK